MAAGIVFARRPQYNGRQKQEHPATTERSCAAVKRKFEYKWIILFAAFLMVFVCLGFCSSNKGVYLSAITSALGIRRSLFSINDTCRFVATAVTNLFYGTLIARFGTRKLVAVGFAALIGSTLIYAYADSIFIFYIGGTLLGIGLSFTTTTTASNIIRQWFHKDLGRYTGIVFAANGIGGALAAQLAAPLINEPGNPFGYRNSYLMVVAILVVTGILVVGLLREVPGSSAPVKKKARGALWVGIPYEQVRRQPYFYFTAGIILMTGFILQSIAGVYAAHVQDVGLGAGFAATVASVCALSMTVTKILVGVLYDRYGLRTVTTICQCACTVSFLLMATLGASPSGHVRAIVFAMLFALALPLETLVIPLIVNDLFGSASYEKILGICIAMNYTGYAIGSPLVNLGYDIIGSYSPIFMVFGLLMIPTCFVFRRVIGAAHREKEKILAAAEEEA